MDKKKIGVIFGGRSSEYEVSLLSAASVIENIDRDKYDLIFIGITRDGAWKHYKGDPSAIAKDRWEESAAPLNIGALKELIDFALPIMHGPYCEDGKIQGLLEMLDIPYGGCGVMASSVAMDKQIAKQVFAEAGLPVCRHAFVTRSELTDEMENTLDRVERALGYPCFIKPANMGSSVGVSKAKNRDDLKAGLLLALQYDSRIVVEEFIECRELETGILGNDYPQAAEVGEILPSAEFYDYDDKYKSGTSKLCIPAEISPKTREEIRMLAVKAYKAVGGEGFSRVDFFIDKKTGRVLLNEINTIPGFTKFSMFPLLWEAAGVKYQDTIERIIKLGYERYNIKNSR